MEDAFWEVLKELADRRGLSINQLVAEVDEGRSGNLSSAFTGLCPKRDRRVIATFTDPNLGEYF